MASPVFPGETLETRMWKRGSRIHFEYVCPASRAISRGPGSALSPFAPLPSPSCRVPARNETVLSNGYIDLQDAAAKPTGTGTAATAKGWQVRACVRLEEGHRAVVVLLCEHHWHFLIMAPPLFVFFVVPLFPQADAVFSTMASRVSQDLVRKVKAVFRFVISRGSDTRTWTVDLRNGGGSVKESADGKADCTLTLSDANLADLVAGKKDAMKLFMGGQLKLSGNMMLAQKLQTLFKAEAPATSRRNASATATALSDTGASPKVVAIFKGVQQQLSALGAQLPYVFLFHLGGDIYITVDGKGGKVYGGQPEGGAKADCTLTLAEDKFLELAGNPSSAMSLFMSGQLSVSGNMMLAQKLQTLFQKQAKL